EPFGDPLMAHDSGSVTCMRSTCSKTWYSVNINCGGNQEAIGRTMYDGDLDLVTQGFAKSATNWAISNTGHFLDANKRISMSNKTRVSPVPLLNCTEMHVFPLFL
ncbi:probable leucine-rich repeat receptor-like serine/threonine-protein kinase At3g14840, partial [Neltuma alba]|uniref:probable leucine-rich repeat receptor-like serine/threonine-protein kinase At3g14840 n=1 Tax=Neltuma alba TaxID=207710 RepID=UPI0010A2C1AF